MAEESFITDEMRKAIGMESEPQVFVFERGALQRYLEAVGDNNPLWLDEGYARQHGWARCPIPPNWLVTVIAGAGGGRIRPPRSPSLTRSAAGGDVLEIYQPVYLGDTITSMARIADIQQHNRRNGPMVTTIQETIYTNQLGEVVAKDSSTGLSW